MKVGSKLKTPNVMKVSIIILVVLVFPRLGLSSSPPFPIYLCGANRNPIPYSLALEDCEDLLPSEPLEVYAQLEIIDRGDQLVSLNAWRCHKVVSFAGCMEWFLGVKDVRYWLEVTTPTYEECLLLRNSSLHHARSHIFYPTPECIWWGNNTRREEVLLYEPTTVFSNLLTTSVVIPGLLSDPSVHAQHYTTGTEWIFLDDLATQMYESAFVLAHRTVNCSRAESRVSCPSEGLLFWVEDIEVTQVMNLSYFSIGHGVFIRNTTVSSQFLASASFHPKVRGDPEMQYLLSRIVQIENKLSTKINSLLCRLKQLRHHTALALSPVDPLMAARVYLGTFAPGVTLSLGGLYKYPCQEVTVWQFDSTRTGYRDVPITYHLPTGDMIEGFLDATSLQIKSRSILGESPRYIWVNNTHLYDYKSKHYLNSHDPQLIPLIALSSIRGVGAFNEDELEAMSSIGRMVGTLFNRQQDDSPAFDPTSHTVYALKDTPALDMIRSSQNWLSSLFHGSSLWILKVGGICMLIVVGSVIIVQIIKSLITRATS